MGLLFNPPPPKRPLVVSAVRLPGAPDVEQRVPGGEGGPPAPRCREGPEALQRRQPLVPRRHGRRPPALRPQAAECLPLGALLRPGGRLGPERLAARRARHHRQDGLLILEEQGAEARLGPTQALQTPGFSHLFCRETSHIEARSSCELFLHKAVCTPTTQNPGAVAREISCTSGACTKRGRAWVPQKPRELGLSSVLPSHSGVHSRSCSRGTICVAGPSTSTSQACRGSNLSLQCVLVAARVIAWRPLQTSTTRAPRAMGAAGCPSSGGAVRRLGRAVPSRGGGGGEAWRTY